MSLLYATSASDGVYPFTNSLEKSLYVGTSPLVYSLSEATDRKQQATATSTP